MLINYSFVYQYDNTQELLPAFLRLFQVKEDFCIAD